MYDEWGYVDLLTSFDNILLSVDREDVESGKLPSLVKTLSRYSSTKDLARDCCGNMEISFNGYEKDPRELYEIQDVRSFV